MAGERPKLPTNERLDLKRSLVRRVVTYGAGAFLFIGGGGLIAWLKLDGNHAEAKDLFLAILPVSSAIISYWFASQSGRKEN